MRTHTLLAIFKRNFVSYFSSPIGYVFICAFVALSAVAAFWPNEFFNTNLANLGQLNQRIAWILLIFIPAITMSVWADERRQGTDELLLTLPATDLEVVVGKYLAAVLIYAVSLLFSLSNILVLAGLGDPDLGLLAANYFGFFCVGSAMIAIGMVASFVTGNLTVAFVLGVILNAPLVFAGSANAIIPSRKLARWVESSGFIAQFEDFGRGLVSFSSIVYFLAIIVVCMYLAMVLIGRRHWSARRSAAMVGHYALRALALVAMGAGAVVVANRLDVRVDTTQERLSSLSSETKTILDELEPERPVYIEAYISPDVPREFAQTRLDLLTMLREVGNRAGDRVVVRINDTERFSREASEAEAQFGILARPVSTMASGKVSREDIFLGAAVMSGLDKVVIPFFDRGVPVEYELIRSIATVSGQTRKTVGVLKTDAKLFGGFDMESFQSRPDEQIITELRKQYDVVAVDPSSPITEKYDVLLAVQPSGMTQTQIDHFVGAVERGQPTAIFEDPFPFLNGAVQGTSQPRSQGNPFQRQQQPPEPKGSIVSLWATLGVSFLDRAIVWDDYNPYPKIEGFYPEFLFVSGEGFGEGNVLTDGLRQIVLLFAGEITKLPGRDIEFTPLLTTGRETGTIPMSELIIRNFLGQTGLNPQRRHIPTRNEYVLGARIKGPLPGEESATSEAPLDVVLVSDMDVLMSAFFQVRAAGAGPEDQISFAFDNVNFVLNALDELAGDDRFIPIRGRRPAHRTLTAVEERTEDARARANDERKRFTEEFDEQQAAEEAKLQAEVEALRAREGVDAREMELEIAMRTQVGRNRLTARVEELEKERDRSIERIERDLALEIRGVQNRYKFAAVGLPPIPPLIVAIIIYFRRRSQERLGVPASRLRGASASAGAGS